MEDGWGDFFAAQVGGSAALLGLLFVGVSLNLSQVLKSNGLANRALIALLLLLIVMIVSLIFLIPKIGDFWLALLMTGIGTALLVGGNIIQAAIAHGSRGRKVISTLNIIAFEISAVPYAVAGALFFFGHGSGIYWAAAATIFSIIKATIDAWVLLVEINR